jgi:hypothetical protein
VQSAGVWAWRGEGPPIIQFVGEVHVDIKEAMGKDVMKSRTRLVRIQDQPNPERVGDLTYHCSQTYETQLIPPLSCNIVGSKDIQVRHHINSLNLVVICGKAGVAPAPRARSIAGHRHRGN